jgi:hypothetical protein
MDAATDDFPATSPPLPDDYSDVASPHSGEEGTERRKYQRGGRKKTKPESRMPPVPEPQIATEPEHREELKMEEEKLPNGTSNETSTATACPECAARKQKEAEPKTPTPFETGIRAFNLKKAASSGSRPVGVRTASESKKSKKKSAKKKKKKAKPEVKEESEEESSSEEEEDGEPETKPMSIRLDLNLVIEIFLKAKIQGDVTITFL